MSRLIALETMTVSARSVCCYLDASGGMKSVDLQMWLGSKNARVFTRLEGIQEEKPRSWRGPNWTDAAPEIAGSILVFSWGQLLPLL